MITKFLRLYFIRITKYLPLGLFVRIKALPLPPVNKEKSFPNHHWWLGGCFLFVYTNHKL